MTRIKSVSFRSGIQIAPFQHAHVEVCADVPANGSPSHVLEELKAWVAAELKVLRDGEPPTTPTRPAFTEQLRGKRR